MTMAANLRRPVALFLLLTLVCAALLAATAALTGDRIADNRARQFLDTVTALTGRAWSADDIRWQDDVAVLDDGTALLRGTARGYGGELRWLAAVARPAPGAALRLQGLRVVSHQETPGIADFLDQPERGWLASLTDRDAEGVGAADAVTGATITSRALQRSLAAALATALEGEAS